MSNQITTAFVQEFSDLLIMLAQQKGSLLRDSVLNKMVTGDAAYFERIGQVNAILKTSRAMASPQMDTPHSRRRVTLNDFVWGDLIDKEDEVRMLIDPQSSYAISGGYAMGRSIDDAIIAAAIGNSTSVTSSLTASTSQVSLTGGLYSDNIISSDFGVANSNLTVAKLIEARRILKHHQVDMSEEFTFVLNASAEASLLNTTQVTSADYNTVKALVSGDIDTFMGFKFVSTERLLGNLSTSDAGSPVAGSTTGPIMCLAFARSGIGLALGKDITVRIQERPDINFATYVHAAMSIGAVRVEEEKVVQINCYQTA